VDEVTIRRIRLELYPDEEEEVSPAAMPQVKKPRKNTGRDQKQYPATRADAKRNRETGFGWSKVGGERSFNCGLSAVENASKTSGLQEAPIPPADNPHLKQTVRALLEAAKHVRQRLTRSNYVQRRQTASNR